MKPPPRRQSVANARRPASRSSCRVATSGRCPRALASALLALAASGCAETVVRSGLPAGDTAPDYDARWHDGFLFGTVEPAEDAPLGSVCPRGWSEVRVAPTFMSGLLGWATLGVYTPSVVTVVCAAPPGVYAGAPGEMPLPPICR